MPPVTLCTSVKPCCTSHELICMLRTPWWHSTTVCADGSSSSLTRPLLRRHTPGARARRERGKWADVNGTHAVPAPAPPPSLPQPQRDGRTSAGQARARARCARASPPSATWQRGRPPAHDDSRRRRLCSPAPAQAPHLPRAPFRTLPPLPRRRAMRRTRGVGTRDAAAALCPLGVHGNVMPKPENGALRLHLPTAPPLTTRQSLRAGTP